MATSQYSNIFVHEAPANKAPCFQICKLPDGGFILTAYEENTTTRQQSNSILVQISKESALQLWRFLT